MKTMNRFLALMLVSMLVLATQAVWGQPNYRFKIYATDGVYSDSVTIGLWSSATYGLDTIVAGVGDTIKEVELPPAALAGNFNFRSADLAGRVRATGQGVGIDIRHSAGNALQLDTIRLQFQSSDAVGAGAVTFSWPSNLYPAYGYGGFRLEDGSGLPVPLFSPVDMTHQSQFTHPHADAAHNQYVNIIIGDGYRFRTFPADSIAMAVDGKGKQKSVPPTGTGSDWTLSFTYPAGLGAGATGLLVSFGQNVLQWYSSVTIDPPSKPSTKVFHLLMSISNGGGVVTLSGKGDKGKAMAATAYVVTGNNNNVPNKITKVGAKIIGAGTTRITSSMPNINNILDELYVQGHFPIDVGAATSPVRIRAKKAADVEKALAKINKGVYTLHSTTGRCYKDYDAKNKDGAYDFSGQALKDVSKPLGVTDPTKYNNRLFAELLALKINLLASAAGKIPTGLNLLVVNSTDPAYSTFNGQNLDAIVAKVDNYMSNCPADTATAKPNPYTGAELSTLLHAINDEFKAVFDTAGGGFTVPHGSKTPDKKTGATWLLGVKSTLMSTLLQQVVPDVEPVIEYGKNYSPTLSLPEKFTVMQNYPNPFNPTTTIQFTLPEDALVTVKVYNILGQEVTTLADHEQFSSGSNTLEFNAGNLASGIYFYRVVVNDGRFQEVKKMVLMK